MQYNKITTFLNKEDITLLFNQYPISINIRRASKNKNNNTEQEFFPLEHINQQNFDSIKQYNVELLLSLLY